MPLIVNLRHVEEHPVALKGELPVDELDMDTRDEMIRVARPLRYDIEIQKSGRGFWVRGSLQLTLECQCVRCLKPFTRKLELKPWTCHLPLEGEERVTVVDDCADLTLLVINTIFYISTRDTLFLYYSDIKQTHSRVSFI